MVTVPPPSSSSSIIPLPPVVIVLTVISIVGAIAIPFGDPQFIDRAIVLELSFVTLAIVILLGDRLTVRRVPLAKLALYACIPPCNHCNGGELACIASR